MRETRPRGEVALHGNPGTITVHIKSLFENDSWKINSASLEVLKPVDVSSCMFGSETKLLFAIDIKN